MKGLTSVFKLEEEHQKNGSEAVVKEIMVRNFPKYLKGIAPHV